MSNADTYLHKRLDHCTTETRVPLNLQYFPLQTGTVQRLAMASRLLNFQVWDGSANIAARHSSIRPIGAKSEDSGVVFLDLIVCHGCYVQARELGLPTEEIGVRYGSPAKTTAAQEKRPTLRR